MRRCVWISVVVLLAASQAGAEVRISLKRSNHRDDSLLPYRPAELMIDWPGADDSSSGRIIRGVILRSTRGGPGMFYTTTIAPGASSRLSVTLPVLSTQETYRVGLFSKGGGEASDSRRLHQFDVPLDWPAQWVTADAFGDPQAYLEGDYAPPRWSGGTLGGVFAVAAVGCLVLAAMLFVRTGGRRLLGVCLMDILTAEGLWLAASAEPIVVQRAVGDDGRLLLVACRRSTSGTIHQGRLVPLYYNMQHMAGDTSVILPGGAIELRLSAGQVRLFARK